MKQVQQEPAVGAQPDGVADEKQAAAAVRDMFSSIAPRYDLLNHVLSFNVDRYWWWRAARTFRHILAKADAAVLDLCCGTGDMGRAVRRQARSPRIVGADFAHPMLQRARQKTAAETLDFIEADALQLPVASGRFDLVVSAFGFRNLANYAAGLDEIRRVLRAGGEVGILDFGEPAGIMGVLYSFYFRRVLPKIGSSISGVRGPYAYLPASVQRFPAPEQMLALMRKSGFADVSWTPYTFGIAGLYRGKKT